MAIYAAILLLLILGAWGCAVARWAVGSRVLPAGELGRKPFGLWSAVAVVVLYFLVSFAVALALMATMGPIDPDELTPDRVLMLGAVINAALLPLVPLTVRAISGARLASLGLPGHRPLEALGLGVWLFLLVLPIVMGIMIGTTLIWKPQPHPIEEMLKAKLTGETLLLAVASAVILAPLAEELMFRGVIQSALTNLFFPRHQPVLLILDDELPDPGNVYASPAAEVAKVVLAKAPTVPAAGAGAAAWIPNIITSALFAIVHGPQWPAPLPLFVLSLGFGLAYQRTGSLYACIIMHVLFNANSTILLVLASN